MTRTLALPVLALVVLSLGCMERRDPINRVQANAVAKSFFVGEDLVDISDDPEFYMRATIIDVGYGTAQEFMVAPYGLQISRIKWEIAEDSLNARLAYERIPGTDSKGNMVDGAAPLTSTTVKCYGPGDGVDGGAAEPVCKTSNDGQVVASYRIQSHFDIKRAYNPTTGEPLDVIEENTTDRPWYQREYFRVDWSSNLTTSAYDFDVLAYGGMIGAFEYEPLAYAVLDPNDDNAPHFDAEQGYFDVTTKAFAKPLEIDISSLGWGLNTIPACWLPGYFAGGTEPYGNCNPSEITVRHSYRRVVDTDYQPSDEDGLRFQAFGGISRQARIGFERRYGQVDARWYRFLERYNVWERSHYYDDPEAMTGPIPCATEDTSVTPTGDPQVDVNRDTDGNGTADECEEVTARTQAAGSRCDYFTQKCTLPFVMRQTRTLPFYFGGSDDADLFEATDWAMQEWDNALRAAVQVARLVECRKTSSDCDPMFPMWTGQHEDYQDAARIQREFVACERQKGWGAEECLQVIDALVEELASERGASSDAAAVANARAMAPVLKLPHIFVMCHNPVVVGDHPACGAAGLKVRLGDIRYHQVTNLPHPMTNSPWGVMFPTGDPLTGEVVAASINIFGQVTDFAAQRFADYVRLANGELKPEEVTDGKYITDYVQASKLTAGGLTNFTMRKEEVTARVAAATKLDPSTVADLLKTTPEPQVAQALAGLRQDTSDVAVTAEAASTYQAEVLARMGQARGTPTEAKLLNSPMLQLAAVPGSTPIAGGMLSAASPLSMNNPRIRADLKRMRERGLSARGACVVAEAPEPTSTTGFADIMARKFPAVQGETKEQTQARWESMFRYIRRRYHYSILAHEMGHGVGLEHNFVASAGALHYWPQYWQLRTRNGAVTQECTDAVSDGSTCVGPRYFDPITEDERKGMLWMWQTGSIMDYPGDQAQDVIGLSIYDYAAVRMFYTDTVAVYTSPDITETSSIGGGLINDMDSFGGIAGLTYSRGSGDANSQFHYSQLQSMFGVLHGCYPASPREPSWWRRDVDGEFDPLLDGQIVSVDGTPTKCRQMPVDYVGWNDLRQPPGTVGGVGYQRAKGPSVLDMPGGSTRVRVNYHFASDRWADSGNASVFRHDSGADPYEFVQFLINTHEDNHIFDNYRRGRTAFSVRASADRSFQRYNEKISGITSGMGFYGRWIEGKAPQMGYGAQSLWALYAGSFLKDNVIAASLAFDHFARQMSRPEDGDHYKITGDPVLRSMNDADGSTYQKTAEVTIPTGVQGILRDVSYAGHPIENALDETKGEYAVDYPLVAGSYYDKINAIIHLSISEDRFISQSRGDFYDARFRSSGVPDLFTDGYRRLIANALVNDRSILAPQLQADASGKVLVDEQMRPTKPMGWTSWWPKSGPVHCFSSQGRNLCQTPSGVELDPDLPASTVPLDPEFGWEMQKFVIAWVLSYVPANWQAQWTDMLKIYRLGPETTPAFENRIEWQDPISGDLYYARTYGKECLFGTDAACTGGKMVERGIAARVLEYANELAGKGFLLDPTRVVDGLACDGGGQYPAGYTKFGRPCLKRQPDDGSLYAGGAIVLSDPSVCQISGSFCQVMPTCDRSVQPDCTPLDVGDNRFAQELKYYKSVPDYLWESLVQFGLGDPHELGLYP
jgi:hypothetical protein